ncbi:MAG: MFS transporter [Streptosporangiales bacterium]|nr:MFS transporter [Streptosporangiales bacterium]
MTSVEKGRERDVGGRPPVPDRTRWSAVVAVAVMVFMTGLDMTVVAVALPDLSTDLGVGPGLAQLAVLAYLVPVIAFMLPAGGWVDRTGRRRAFLVAVAGFGGSSALVAVAGSLGLVLAARAVQGLFGATVGALSFAVVAAVVRPEHRGRAQGLVAMLGPLGSVAGPGVGGLLVSAYGWRAAFLVNLPVCLLAAVLGARAVPRIRGGGGRPAQWLRGVAEMARGRAVAPTLAVLLAGTTVTGAYNALLPFLLQRSWHHSAAVAGMLLLVPPATMALLAPGGGMLADRWGPWRIQLAGTLTLVAGAGALFATVVGATRGGDTADLVRVFVTLVLVGAGSGLILGPNGAMLMSAAPPNLAGSIGSLAGLARTAGFALGPALAVLAWQATGDAGTVTGLAIVIVIAGVAVAAAVVPPLPAADTAPHAP